MLPKDISCIDPESCYDVPVITSQPLIDHNHGRSLGDLSHFFFPVSMQRLLSSLWV